MWSTSPAERTVIVPPRFAGVPFPALCAAKAAAAAMPAATTASTRTAGRRRPIVRFTDGDIAPPSGVWSRRFWIKGIANPVAEQVEGEHGGEKREAGEQEEPPGGGEDRRRLGDHLAPARLGRVDPDAEVGEGRLQQDVLRDDQCRVDDDRSDEVREDLAEEDREVARPGGAGSLDELLLAERDDLPADDPADVRPVDDDDRDSHRRQPRLDQAAGAAVAERARGGDPEGEQQDRERQ